MRYAILCPPALGHLHPFMAIARELEQRQHQVIFYQLPDYVERVRAKGFIAREFGSSEFPAGEWKKISEALAQLAGDQAMAHFIRAVERKSKVSLAELPGLLSEDKIDFILADQVGLESSTIAEKLRLPFATICNGVPLDPDPSSPPFFTSRGPAKGKGDRRKNARDYFRFAAKVQSTFDLINRFRLSENLRPLRNRGETYSKRLKLIQLPRFLDFPRKAEKNRYWTGPLIDEALHAAANFPWELLNGKPLVYVSLGSEVNGEKEFFQMLVQALEQEGYQLVVSLGRKGVDASGLAGRADTLVLDFVPQPQLLARCALFVTHAGMNSFLEAARAGVPMLAIPFTNDQFGAAARVEEFHLGRALSKSEASVDSVRIRVNEIRNSAKIQHTVLEVASRIRKGSGPRCAVDLILRCL